MDSRIPHSLTCLSTSQCYPIQHTFTLAPSMFGMWPSKSISLTNETWTAKDKTSSSTSNPHGPIKVSEKPHHPVQKCLVETIFAEPNRHCIDFVYERHFCRVTY